MNPNEQEVPGVPEAELPYVKSPEKKRWTVARAIVLVPVLLVIVAAVVFGGMYIYNTLPQAYKSAVPLIPTPTPFVDEKALVNPSTWVQFASKKYDVSFRHPAEWTAIERFKNYDSLLAFAIYDPIYVILEKYPLQEGITESVKTEEVINGVTWYQPDPDKRVDKSGDFCSLYNCDQLSYGKFYTIRDGVKYSFYFPRDIETTMRELLRTFSFVE